MSVAVKPVMTKTVKKGYDIITWELNGYKLSKITSPEKDVRWMVEADYELPSVHELGFSWKENPGYGVNWSAMGTKSPHEAFEYAGLLKNAAEAAFAFNEIRNADSLGL